MDQVREALPVFPAVRIERAPDPVAGVEPHCWPQVHDRRDEIPQCVVPGPLFVAEGRIVVPRIVLFAEVQPAPRGEPQRVRVRVDGKGEPPRAREVLALIELDEKSRVGDPVVAACQHVASHERADAVSAIALKDPGHLPKHQVDRGSLVSCEPSLPSESVVGHTRSVDTLEKLPDPDLAGATPLGVAPRGNRTRPPHRWRGYKRDADVADATAAVALGHDEAAAPEKLIGLQASRESTRAQQLARGDLMGQRNRVFRGQMLALRRQAVASAPSLPWYPVTDDEPYSFLDVCPRDAPWDHCLLQSHWRFRSVARIKYEPVEKYSRE